MRQGDVISPMIFNLMVDAVVRHWEVTAKQSDDVGFYADDGRLSGHVHSEVQHSLGFITDCFATMGLRMNADKTVFLSTTSRGITPIHKNGRPVQDPQRFVVSVPGQGMEVNCPVDGCVQCFKTPSSMQQHFRAAHIEHEVFIPEQGVLPRCPLCKCVGAKVGLEKHRSTNRYKKERRRYQNYQAFLVEQESRTKSFNVRGQEIRRVDQFNFLGRVVSEDDDDSRAIEANIKKGESKVGDVYITSTWQTTTSPLGVSPHVLINIAHNSS